TGQMQGHPLTHARITDLAQGTITHSFVLIPGCPYSLLGRDLLHKLKAQISFTGKSIDLNLPPPAILVTCPISEEYLPLEKPERKASPLIEKWKETVPTVWTETNPPGLAIQQASLSDPVSVRQYPISQQAREGIAKHNCLQDAGILMPCHSPWNTPLLPVPKPGTLEYRPVQDLREINKRVETIHPTVPNPYTLLSGLSPNHCLYSVLDLKDVFFALPIAKVSQPIFAFEWTDPDGTYNGQLTWMRLPQGFKNS
ncbi:POL5 protein, partial [Crocuta crocuta]